MSVDDVPSEAKRKARIRSALAVAGPREDWPRATCRGCGREVVLILSTAEVHYHVDLYGQDCHEPIGGYEREVAAWRARQPIPAGVA